MKNQFGTKTNVAKKLYLANQRDKAWKTLGRYQAVSKRLNEGPSFEEIMRGDKTKSVTS